MRTTRHLDLQAANNPAHRHIVLVVSTWLLLVVLTSINEGYDTAPGQLPLALMISLLTPLVLFSASYGFLPGFRCYVLNLDMRVLILLHSWRMLGLGFLMLYSANQLPWLFALPAGIGDAVTAVTALFLAVALFKRADNVKPAWIASWNSFGLLDFIVAVSMGVLTRPGFIAHLPGEPSSGIMSTFPFALIPGFVVPLLILSHIAIYLQLHMTTQPREKPQ